MRTELYIEGNSIDLSEDIAIPLTFQVSDIKEPENRKGSFSKTIVLQGTKNNNTVLTHVYEIDKAIQQDSVQLAPDFNPNLKAAFQLYQDSVLIFQGTAQLMNVRQGDMGVEYEVVLYSDSVSLFTSFNDDTLSALDFSEYNHEFNLANTSGSWQDYIIKDGTPEAFALGSGYVYPLIDRALSTLPDNVHINTLSPALYLKTVIDKVFSTYGYSYESAFFESEFFKRLIIPSRSDNYTLTSDEIRQRSFSANTNADTDIYADTVKVESLINYGNENYDFGSNFNINTFTAPENGYYSFIVKAVFDWVWELDYIASPSFAFHVWIAVKVNGDIKQSIGYTVVAESNETSGTKVSASVRDLVLRDIRLTSGDEVKTYVIIEAVHSNVKAANGKVRLKSGSYFYNIISKTTLEEGMTVNMNKALPKNIKISEFMSSVFRLFNCYVMPDRDNARHLIIEPYPDFFTDEAVDWSDKIDVGQDIEIIPMGELNAVRYKFRYKEDKDYLNEQHLKMFSIGYGDRDVVINNDFTTDEKVIEVIFSNTPLSSRNGSPVMAGIYGSDNGNIIPLKENNIRLLLYGGLKTGLWTLRYSSGQKDLTQYPFAGHLDDAFNPVYDLCFAPPRYLFYLDFVNYTDNNVYNRFWKKYITEITDKDSKVVRAWAYLTSVDIATLDFRKLYFWHDHYFRLLKITDYNPLSSKPVLCEFLKVQEADVFVPTTKKIWNGWDDSIGDDTLPNLPDAVSRDNLIPLQDNDNIVNGDGNIIGNGSVNITITGDNNVVGSDCSCINIQCSSGNTVMAGLSNVVLINCSGLTIEESDVTYINNTKVE